MAVLAGKDGVEAAFHVELSFSPSLTKFHFYYVLSTLGNIYIYIIFKHFLFYPRVTWAENENVEVFLFFINESDNEI